MANLAEVNKTLVQQNEILIGIAQSTDATEKMMLDEIRKTNKFKDIEAKREAQNKSAAGSTRGGSKIRSSSLDGMFLGLGLLSGFIASLTAFAAGIAGLRGWEVNAIKVFNGTIRDFSKIISAGTEKLFKRIRVATIGRFANVLNLLNTRITQFINMRLENLGLLRFEQLRDAAGKFTGERLTPLQKINNFFGRVSKALGPIGTLANTLARISFFPITVLLGDITRATQGVSDLAGKNVMTKIADLGTKIAKFGGVFARILKPIGFIFSFVDGISTALKTEGDLLDKLIAGVSAFLGDFIGAPLDLLKDLLGFILGKLGFENAKQFLSGFSIEEKLKEFYNAVFQTIRDFFSDPIGTAIDVVGKIGDIISGLFDRVIKAIAAKFGITIKSDEDKLREQREEIRDDIETQQGRVSTQQAELQDARNRRANILNEIAELENRDVSMDTPRLVAGFNLGGPTVEASRLETLKKSLPGAGDVVAREERDVLSAQNRLAALKLDEEAITENLENKNRPAVVMQDSSSQNVVNNNGANNAMVAPLVSNNDVNDSLSAYATGGMYPGGI